MPMAHNVGLVIFSIKRGWCLEHIQAVIDDVPFGVLTGTFYHVAAESIEAAIAESDGDAL